MNNLVFAKNNEGWRIKHKENMLYAMDNRNIYISAAFKSGYSQKEIANAVGLSESTIKHIIAKLKKE